MMNMQVGDVCLLTGAFGYPASWIGKELPAAGLRVREMELGGSMSEAPRSAEHGGL
jgi:hypothetical protein